MNGQRSNTTYKHASYVFKKRENGKVALSSSLRVYSNFEFPAFRFDPFPPLLNFPSPKFHNSPIVIEDGGGKGLKRVDEWIKEGIKEGLSTFRFTSEMDNLPDNDTVWGGRGRGGMEETRCNSREAEPPTSSDFNGETREIIHTRETRGCLRGWI